MNVAPDILQAIQRHPSDDVALIARDVGRELGRTSPVTLVVKVKGSVQRATDVSHAKQAAASTLDTKVGRIEKASLVLEELFLDEGLALKDRIEASKELRQWTKLGMDAAGIADEENDTLFVIEGQWDPTPRSP